MTPQANDAQQQEGANPRVSAEQLEQVFGKDCYLVFTLGIQSIEVVDGADLRDKTNGRSVRPDTPAFDQILGRYIREAVLAAVGEYPIGPTHICLVVKQ